MKLATMFILVFGLAVLVGGYPSTATEQDEDVRGAFLTSRPKTTNKSGTKPEKAVRRRPKATPTPQVAGPSGPSKPATPVSDKKPASDSVAKIRAQKIGMGLTLFMRDSNGLSVRVNPTREFRKGDRVRLLLETNSDGYLYVFNTTDDGPPIMIYPDPDLDEAGNYIQAHVPVEVPSSIAQDERLRWFRFDDQAGVERLFFVFTREPLPGIPLEDELISFCRAGTQNCPLKPTNDLWAQVQKDRGVPVNNAKASEYGSAQTATEQEATTRGIGLNKDDPEPALVMMTASTTTNVLVTTLDLIHK